MNELNDLSLTEITKAPEETISFDELSINSIEKKQGVVGTLEPLANLKMQPGWNVLNITNLPESINSVSVWITEGSSIARGGYASTYSVQLDLPKKLVRIRYHWSWKSACKLGAQCFWNFK